MTLSPQSQTLYQILLSSTSPLSIKEVATKLKVNPATVYRLTKPLISMGLITKSASYPYKFTAKPVDQGLSLFLLHQTNWFSSIFSSANKSIVKQDEVVESREIQISFIQSRDELMNQAAKEINKAAKSVDLLRSGNEMTADVMLAITEARKRNIITRMLIQDYSKENEQQVSNWHRNGILVRKTPLRHLRLMLFDSSSLYFMSYKHTDSKKDSGVKINYPPFAAILSQLFESWWEKAERI